MTAQRLAGRPQQFTPQQGRDLSARGNAARRRGARPNYLPDIRAALARISARRGALPALQPTPVPLPGAAP